MRRRENEVKVEPVPSLVKPPERLWKAMRAGSERLVSPIIAGYQLGFIMSGIAEVRI